MAQHSECVTTSTSIATQLMFNLTTFDYVTYKFMSHVATIVTHTGLSL